ncbi:S8 family serine peptidase [Pontibacter cellulosilyticus]|uniref:S8 family serine peptidase n=1 Tax=Pontibacter cellulosilyticus TaxID=1720253 RepID=A0A923N8S4_9BACT|nr:S8 family serine peptidase [Pontibacter cellulosilyticus]MBC5994903.1 S8 family serine peptidase [Pontibacter cellulosilyticus]
MRRLSLWLVATAMATATTAFAQRGDAPSVRANVSELGRIAVAAEKDYKASRNKALQLAKKHGWVVEKTYSDGTFISLQGLDAKGMPIYYITYNNSRAAASVGTTELWAGGSLGLSLSGASNSVAEKLGVWDGGRVRESHQELTGRVIQKDNPSSSSEHATHVAGTMMAKGVNPLAKGMSFGLKKLAAYDFSNDVSEMAAAASELLISNHSYGAITGWRYNSDRKGTTEDPYWEWWGDTEISATEDYRFGYYNETASSWDRIAYNAPYYLIVKSAGNNRVENGPAVGQPYYQRDNAGKFTKIDARPAGMNFNNGFDIISTYGTAKNILTVGAVNPISEGYRDTSDVVISSFSSFGPTDDGRIKPDLVGNGVSVLSTSDKSNTAYTSLSGTSMASPNVAGSLLLLQEHYANLKNGQVMRAATLKGLAIHTTDEAGKTAGPDYKFGWGLLNVKRAASVISNTNNTNLIQENSLAQGQTYTYQVVASGSGPLVVTISWTDPEATPFAIGSSALNNRTARLINDIDVRVAKGSTIYQPWVLDPASPASAATTGDNKLDNVEQVKIMNAVPGETYTITVNHKGTLLKGPQAYSMIVSGIGGTAVCESKATSDQGTQLTKVTLGNTFYSFIGGCRTYMNLTDRIFMFEPGQQQNLSLELGTCTTDAAKIAKVYIDWNRNGSFTDAGEEVAASTVLNGNATFTGSITAPATAQVGTSARMRIVVQETSNSADVTSCGTYSRGETQDYLVQFVQPKKDVGVSAVLPVGTSLCANPAQQIVVNIKNYGTTSQSNIPVTVSVLKNNAEIKQISFIYIPVLEPNAQVEVLLSETFATEAGATYEFVATAALQGDPVEENNRKIRAFSVGTPAGTPVNASAFRCGTDPNYALSATGNGAVYWYNSATSTTPIAAGNQILVPASQINGKLFAAYNDFAGTIGPANKKFASGGGYNTFSPDVIINTKAPVILESARLYIGNSGKITFTVFNEEGAPVSAKTLYVTATRSTPAPGPQTDDPSDQGAIYYLGLELPAAGTYNIAISYENGATIFRNNAGVTGYPFQVGNVVSITGNTATTTPESYYYYFYDMKVRALGCAGPRVEAIIKGGTPLQQPAISRSEQKLVSSAAEGNQWYKDDKPVAGATGKEFSPTESGNYSVKVFKDGCISEMSMAYNFSYKPGIRELGTELVVSPNPTTGRFRFELETSQPEDINFEVVDMLGNFILSGKVENYYGQYEGFINLSDKASGLYIFRLRHGDKSYSEKILVQH